MLRTETVSMKPVSTTVTEASFARVHIKCDYFIQCLIYEDVYLPHVTKQGVTRESESTTNLFSSSASFLEPASE